MRAFINGNNLNLNKKFETFIFNQAWFVVQACRCTTEKRQRKQRLFLFHIFEIILFKIISAQKFL